MLQQRLQKDSYMTFTGFFLFYQIWSYYRLRTMKQRHWVHPSMRLNGFTWQQIWGDAACDRENFRLNVDCVASTACCRIWPQIQRNRQRRERWRVLSLFCLVLCFRLKVPFVYSCSCKSFSLLQGWRTEKPTDPSTLKLSTQDQHDPQIWTTGFPISVLPTRFRSPYRLLPQNILANEWISLPSVSQAESSSYISLSSSPKQSICSRHVSKISINVKCSTI